MSTVTKEASNRIEGELYAGPHLDLRAARAGAAKVEFVRVLTKAPKRTTSLGSLEKPKN